MVTTASVTYSTFVICSHILCLQVVYYFFAILGMQIFADIDVRLSDINRTKCEWFTNWVNLVFSVSVTVLNSITNVAVMSSWDIILTTSTTLL